MKPQVLVFDDEATRYVEGLAPLLPDIDFIAATTEAEALARCDAASVLVALAPFIPPRLIESMPRLRWIQALTTGTDNLLFDMPALRTEVLITSLRGIHGPQVAELAILYMLALSRDLRGLFALQAEAKWLRRPQRLLLGRRAVLVGVGTIAENLALRCKSFGMEVVGISSRPREAAGFDQVLPRSALIDAAATADFLIVLLPYAADTHNLIDARVIDAMKPDAVLINLARGRIVDEDALLAALREKRLFGAGLDVFATEPLPADHPFWNCANVIVTPHIGGMSDIYAEQAIPILIENFKAYLASRPDLMKNVVRAGGGDDLFRPAQTDHGAGAGRGTTAR